VGRTSARRSSLTSAWSIRTLKRGRQAGCALGRACCGAVWRRAGRRARSMPSPSAYLSIPGDRAVPPARATVPQRAARARPARRGGTGSPPRDRGGMGQRCNPPMPILTVFRNLFELFQGRFRTPRRERSRLRSDNRGGHMGKRDQQPRLRGRGRVGLRLHRGPKRSNTLLPPCPLALNAPHHAALQEWCMTWRGILVPRRF
jgi:hypothetical protein